MNKKKIKYNWWGIIIIFEFIIILSVVGMSLPPTINKLNNIPENSTYGFFVSYFVALLLFYTITYGIKTTKENGR